MRNQLVKPAGLSVVQLDGRPVAPPFEQSVAGGEIELALRFLATVTLHTMLGENGTYLLLENLQAARHPLGMIRRQRRVQRLFGGHRIQCECQKQTADLHDANPGPSGIRGIRSRSAGSDGFHDVGITTEFPFKKSYLDVPARFSK